jgi:predicted Zn-dependent protease
LKRLPVTEQGQPADVNAEQKVEQLAGQSLKDNEVITETMAEVWEKQGNAEKAIDIYNKLSLLDPSKRTYFATKIEELKKTI